MIGTVTLGVGDARDLLSHVSPGLVRLGLFSPPYLDALDYAAHRTQARTPWHGGARVALPTYLAEQAAILEKIVAACAPDAVLAVEIDDVRARVTGRGAGSLLPLISFWQDLLAGAGFRLVEHIRLIRSVTMGRRSGAFVRSGGRVGTFYPDSVSSALLIAYRGDPMQRLRRAAPDTAAVDVTAFRPALVNAWRLPPPQRNRGGGHPCPMDMTVASRVIALYSAPGDVVLDAFAGSGTTGWAAAALGRDAILIEREPHFAALIASRGLTQPLVPRVRRVLIQSAPLWLPLSPAIAVATQGAFISHSPLEHPSARHRDIAALASASCGVAISPELAMLLLRAERLYCQKVA